MPDIDEGGYLITPREFERMMGYVDEDTDGNKVVKHMAADKLMVKTLNSLGYSAGTKIYEEMEKGYA